MLTAGLFKETCWNKTVLEAQRKVYTGVYKGLIYLFNVEKMFVLTNLTGVVKTSRYILLLIYKERFIFNLVFLVFTGYKRRTSSFLFLFLLNARYKGKSYRATVEIVRTADRVADFCRKTCIKLECCPNLFGPRMVLEHCSENCSVLTKTKYSACFYRTLSG